MNRERELLKKVISGDNKGDFFVSHDLYKEIKEFLAQPEQTEQEPLSREQIEAAREGNTITVHAFARAIEKLHGITGGGE